MNELEYDIPDTYPDEMPDELDDHDEEEYEFARPSSDWAMELESDERLLTEHYAERNPDMTSERVNLDLDEFIKGGGKVRIIPQGTSGVITTQISTGRGGNEGEKSLLFGSKKNDDLFSRL